MHSSNGCLAGDGNCNGDESPWRRKPLSGEDEDEELKRWTTEREAVVVDTLQDEVLNGRPPMKYLVVTGVSVESRGGERERVGCVVGSCSQGECVCGGGWERTPPAGREEREMNTG